MKRFIAFFVLALVIQSCGGGIEGNGVVKEETRETAPFDKIEVGGAFEIYVRPGNYSSLTIKTDENLLPHIESYVKDGELRVSTKERISHFEKLELYLTMQEFTAADLSGACELHSRGVLNGKDVNLDFSGAVEAELELNCRKLNADMSGACELTLIGNAEEAEFDVSGAGEINAEDFETRKCNIEMSGAGEARVFATKELNVDVSGAAEIYYKGDPAEIKRSVSGAATIEPIK